MTTKKESEGLENCDVGLHLFNVMWEKPDKEHPFYHKHCLRECGEVIEAPILTVVALENMER